MERFYFYKKSNDRSKQRKEGLVNFELQALYCEDAYYAQHRNTMKSFSVFDQIKMFCSTKDDTLYDFSVETGTDGCQGHSAKSVKELMDDRLKFNFNPISEKEYLKLRSLALRLLFKQLDRFTIPSDGNNEFFWQNNSFHNQWSFKLMHTNHLYNRRDYEDDFIRYLQERDLGLNDVDIPEYIRLYIFKPKRDGWFKSTAFSISSHHFEPSYQSCTEAVESLLLSNCKVSNILPHQYERLRNIAKYLMYEFSVYDIEIISGKQNHNVTVLF
ncbi:hypothetical protein ACS126_03365 [Sphingobacterium lactis]|uniref:hypothetical protein n=1 Tax=Sphingobacterium TaxID=28453 RepID=UPI0021A75556|nr:hypothetical protein [Sphingobacterium hotanense]MCT1525808.1 hypothetical protein [Sphingobacterium hotanense]